MSVIKGIFYGCQEGNLTHSSPGDKAVQSTAWCRNCQTKKPQTMYVNTCYSTLGFPGGTSGKEFASKIVKSLSRVQLFATPGTVVY